MATVILAKGEAGVSDRWRSTRATALACKPECALQRGIQWHSPNNRKSYLTSSEWQQAHAEIPIASGITLTLLYPSKRSASQTQAINKMLIDPQR
jgi:hypothetical protein